MSIFFSGASLLALLLALVLWPRRAARSARPADLVDPNLHWYRQRSQEVADNPALDEDARLRLLEDGMVAHAARPPGPSTASRWLGVSLVPVVLMLAGLLYWRLGALPDVLIYRDLQALEPGDSRGLSELGASIAERSAQRPENGQYLSLLAQLQLAEEDFSGAAESFAALAVLAPENAGVQAQAAQSRFLANERTLDATAEAHALRALELDPHQRMALGLLGMASFEGGRFSAAVGYWRRLQELESPGSSEHTMLEEVIGLALARGGRDAQPEPRDSIGITVTIEASDPDTLSAGARTLFVFARGAQEAGMPIAVRRLVPSEFPLTLRLSDSDSMAGRLLSEAGDVVISAQLSRNGQPGEQNAAFTARSGPLQASIGTDPVALRLEPVPGG